MLVLDSGAVTRLAERSRASAALLLTLRRRGLWPPVVPSIVLVECLQGHAGRDAAANALLRACEVASDLSEGVARRAARLRAQARRGSAADAVVVASAEPGGTILTTDPGDLGVLAAYADDVEIEPV